MSLAVPQSAPGLTDVSDVNDSDHDEISDYNDNVSQIMIQTEKYLNILAQLDNDTFDLLVDQLQLSLLKKLKQYIKHSNAIQYNSFWWHIDAKGAKVHQLQQSILVSLCQQA